MREALQSLEAEGLVEIEPHRGAVVRPFDAAGLVELYELRAVIEPYAAARAAEAAIGNSSGLSCAAQPA